MAVLSLFSSFLLRQWCFPAAHLLQEVGDVVGDTRHGGGVWPAVPSLSLLEGRSSITCVFRN